MLPFVSSGTMVWNLAVRSRTVGNYELHCIWKWKDVGGKCACDHLTILDPLPVALPQYSSACSHAWHNMCGLVHLASSSWAFSFSQPRPRVWRSGLRDHGYHLSISYISSIKTYTQRAFLSLSSRHSRLCTGTSASYSSTSTSTWLADWASAEPSLVSASGRQRSKGHFHLHAWAAMW